MALDANGYSAIGKAAGGLLGGATKSILGGWGELPDVPQFAPTNSGVAGVESWQSNIINLLGNMGIGGAVNDFNQREKLDQLFTGNPNAKGILDKSGKNYQDALDGILPDGVADEILRNSNNHALISGVGGSEFGRNIGLRDLGRSSLDRMDQATYNAPSFLGGISQLTTTPLYNPVDFMITPRDQIQLDSSNNENQWNRDWLQSQVQAQPDPEAAGWGDALGSL